MLQMNQSFFRILLMILSASFCNCQTAENQRILPASEIVTKNNDQNVSRKVNSNLSERNQQDESASALIEAVDNKDRKKIEELLRQGANPNLMIWKTAENKKMAVTILEKAVSAGDIDTARLLLKYKADVNIGSVVEEQTISPLFTAVEKNDISMIKLLTEYKIDVKSANETNSLFSYNSKEGTIKILKKIGADINSFDKASGMTPLMAAVRYDNYERIKLLVKYGADVNVRTPNGFNVWGFLAEDKDGKITKLLKKLGAKK
jgi:ankyrin repeat protein